MTNATPTDKSNGYEAISSDFMSIRSSSSTGRTMVLDWAQSLPTNASVLDLGCGHGLPITKALLDACFSVYGVDASPSMVKEFRSRFPNAEAECSAIEDSRLFHRRFDGAVAWGLMFLLAPEVQASLVHKVALALKPGGKFLFTAPRRVCEWEDTLTGRRSRSLGLVAYRKIIESEGLLLVGEDEDKGKNHYYFACKPADGQ